MIEQNVDVEQMKWAVTLHESNILIQDPISAKQILIRHLAAAECSSGIRSTTTLRRGRF